MSHEVGVLLLRCCLRVVGSRQEEVRGDDGRVLKEERVGEGEVACGVTTPVSIVPTNLTSPGPLTFTDEQNPLAESVRSGTSALLDHGLLGRLTRLLLLLASRLIVVGIRLRVGSLQQAESFGVLELLCLGRLNVALLLTLHLAHFLGPSKLESSFLVLGLLSPSSFDRLDPRALSDSVLILEQSCWKGWDQRTARGTGM